MKVTRLGRKFEPVHLVLETQEEVDKLFVCFNFTPLAEVLELPTEWEELDPYISPDYKKWQDAVQSAGRSGRLS